MNSGAWATPVLGNPALAWALALVGALLGYAIVRAAVAFARHRCEAAARRRHGAGFDLLARVLGATHNGLLLLFALVVAAGFLRLPEGLAPYRLRLAEALFALQVALWLTRLIAVIVGRFDARSGAPGRSVLSGILSWSAQLAVWALLLLAVLSNLGVNVTAFVASLGVGGIAVALAAQNVLGDLFASISIGLDKPFEVGETIGFGDASGTIRRVGIKSTRIQSLSGEELVISNSQLLQKLVRNYDRMAERRVAFGFGVALDTSRAHIEYIVAEVKALIGSVEKVRLARGHMTGFGSSSLDLEFVYYVLDPSFDVYRDVQQEINLGIMELLEARGVKLAVPARVVHSAG